MSLLSFDGPTFLATWFRTTNALNVEIENSLATVGSGNTSIEAGLFQEDSLRTENHELSSAYARVAFVVDANITSFLMMGFVSPGLKSHVVTLYEAGKLGHASIEDLRNDLSTLEGTKFERATGICFVYELFVVPRTYSKNMLQIL
ncbi:hypothetical protein R6Q59_012147 [Mikania micrantha]